MPIITNKPKFLGRYMTTDNLTRSPSRNLEVVKTPVDRDAFYKIGTDIYDLNEVDFGDKEISVETRTKLIRAKSAYL